jgi:hypothetical protein
MDSVVIVIGIADANSMNVTLAGLQLLHDALTWYWPASDPKVKPTDAVPSAAVTTDVVLREALFPLGGSVGCCVIAKVIGTPLTGLPDPSVTFTVSGEPSSLPALPPDC